ncbi:MAG: S-layer homology domain-containing protein [Clostridia bacterium]|nr:S-layer homology domain-containing protein [Clostridia bacterium]
MKKIVASVLVLCMMISCVPVFAASVASQQTYSTEKLDGEMVIPVTNTVGTWKDSKAVLNYDGAGHTYSQTNGDCATYVIRDIKAGNYELYYWAMPHQKNSSKNTGIIKHNGKEDTVIIDTKIKEDETVAPGWLSLGVYDFAGKGEENFSMTVDGGNVRASAIKLVPTDKPLTDTSAPKEEVKEEETVSDVKSIDGPLTGYCIWTGGDSHWRSSTTILGPMAASPQTMWISGVDEKATMTYYPEMTDAGNIEVSVYLLYWKANQNPQVKYEVHHNGKVDEKILDPTTLTKSEWVSLGTFDFAGNPETEFVKLVCVKPEEDSELGKNTRASTIRFTYADSGTTVYVTPDEKRDAVRSDCAPLNAFSDMADHWAHYDVEYMANEGLVSGVGEGLFDPEAQITRAEYVTILDRAMGYNLISGESYADVPATEWYAPYVATAKANGLLNGLPTDDGFKPNQPITRQEMALFTYNAIKATGKNDEWLKSMPDDYVKFTDTDSVSDWAEEALKYLIKTGIIKGTSETTVSALDNATRAQGAVILKRFMQQFVWAGPPTNQEWIMTFNDEFFGDSLDWGVWSSDNRSPSNLLGGRWPENAVVKDGALSLMTLRERENRGDKEWSTGSVWVRSSVFAQKYGYWEARYKIAASPNINNAFWTYVNWVENVHSTGAKDQHFEVDINEGRYPNVVATTLHNDTLGKRVSTSERYYSEYDLSADYHTYAIEWNEQELIYYFDGMVIFTVPNQNIDELQFPILSSALNLPEGSLPDTEYAEPYMENTAQVIDYVRVWQKPEDVNDPAKTHFGTRVENGGPIDWQIAKESASSATPEASKLSPVDNTSYDGEIVIPAVLSSGWKSSKVAPGYDGGVHYWVNKPGETASFPLKKVVAGKYKVYYWASPYISTIGYIEPVFKTKTGESVIGKVSFALKSEAEVATAQAGWALVGEIDVTDPASSEVIYTCTGQSIDGGMNVRASAIKLVPVK